MCRHGHVSVQVDAEVSNGVDRHNVVGTDMEWCGGNLVHASTRRTSHHFSLCGIKLQLLASHPHKYVVNTGRNGILKTIAFVKHGQDVKKIVYM